jgi:hypothetical protein
VLYFTAFRKVYSSWGYRSGSYRLERIILSADTRSINKISSASVCKKSGHKSLATRKEAHVLSEGLMIIASKFLQRSE